MEGSPGTRGLGADEAIEDREHCGMPAEHVVAACAGPLHKVRGGGGGGGSGGRGGSGGSGSENGGKTGKEMTRE